MSSNNNMTLSKTIMFLRFPLIVAVVFIHTELISSDEIGQYPIYNLIRHVISEEFARIAVPLFFFFSGFLFFYNSNFSAKTYQSKLKNRVRSLLIPYIFWNLLILPITYLSQISTPSMVFSDQALIIDYNWFDYLKIFWARSGGDSYPIYVPFWFIRDLMVMVILSPIIYLFIKYCKFYGILLLGISWLFNLAPNIPGFSITAFFFFSFGAWFSLNNRDFTYDFQPLRWMTTILYLILVSISTYSWYNNYSNYAQVLGIFVGLIALISWTAYGIENNRLKTNAPLAGSSFFVFAYHGKPITLVAKVWGMHIFPTNEFMILVGYFLLPTIIVALGVGIYALMHKHLPTFTSIITGGR